MPMQRMISPFNWFLMALVVLATVAGFAVVPLNQDLPVHWGLSGEADGFAPAPVALAMPIGMLVVLIGLFYALRAARLRKDFENGRFVIDAALGGIAAIALVIIVVTVLIGLGHSVDIPRVLSLAVAAMFTLIGNVLPKTRPNWVAGIRLPWTLRDPDNWQLTHRWTGRAMVVCGLIAFAIAAIGAPIWGLMVAVLGAALLPVMLGVAISYGHAVRHGGDGA
ncbi:MAG: SdpI family protein [Alphaproteobacteria bacterium]|nr:SdpI family protein [Alphaproteobacteria bacterium]